MGHDADDGAGLRIRDHLPNLKEAIEEAMHELQREHADKLKLFDFSVNLPLESAAGEITTSVFDLLNRADLAIFDMSGAAHTVFDAEKTRARTIGSLVSGLQQETIVERPSPNVIYELALAHGLGIPTIPVTLSRAFGTKVPDTFYIAHLYGIQVPDFQTKTLSKHVKDFIDAVFFKKASTAEFRGNEISRYYGRPLVDSSSASGLAATYYNGFLERLLSGGEMKFYINGSDLSEEVGKWKEFKGIILIEPDELRVLSTLKERLAALKGVVKRSISRDVSPMPAISRPFDVICKGDYIIDVPNTIGAVKYSKLFIKRAHLLGVPRAESTLIGSYFECLFSLIPEAMTATRVCQKMKLNELVESI